MVKNLADAVTDCRRCQRLVEHREEVARVKRRAYRGEDYWGAPVPSFGSAGARLLIVGLAPGAHGANRTGRMFTGDKSGDFLYPTLHRWGFCTQPDSQHRNDGLQLRDTFITAILHCVPPGNRPRADEIEKCQPYLCLELETLTKIQVVVCLGKIAFDGFLRVWRKLGWGTPSRKPQFGHATEVRLKETLVIASYHPSQQNTQTGRLTQSMFDAVFERASDEIRRRSLPKELEAKATDYG